MLDIVAVSHHFFFPRVLVTTVDLCHTSNAWFHGENLMICLLVVLDFTRLVWTRSDERHISPKDVPELRELIERETFDELAESHFTRIVVYLVEGTISRIVFCLEFLFILESGIVLCTHAIGVFHTVLPVHIAELVEEKYLPVFSDSSIPKYNGSREILYLDSERDEEE